MKIRISKLDKAFSEFIRKRAVFNKGGCEYCGKPSEWSELQCSHFHSRRKRATRYDPDNCAGLCFVCHSYLGEHPNKHTGWMIKRLGTERYEDLNIRAELLKVKIDEDELILELKERIKVMEG